MSNVRWRCTRPNNCVEKCELDSHMQPTGCVYSDEEDIPRDSKIWMLLDKDGSRSIFDDVDE